MITDTERFDWLEKSQFSLISDDAGRWACTADGMQDVSGDEPSDISTTFFIDKSQWKESIRSAIDYAMEEDT